jgi:hypothetical protein
VDVTLVVTVVLAALVLVCLLGGCLMAWRILHGNEEMEPGGSLGRQMLGRTRKP